jgi:large subunit ribosomal protein L10
MAHVSQKKKEIVKEFTELLDKYSIIGVVNMENLPAKQLQNMRSQLRDKLVMKMTKRTLLNIAIDNCKKNNIAALKDQLKGMPALIFTNENPFALFKFIKKNKSKAPIKGGQKAPNDIIVPAGATNFAPGPIIGELGSFRIKTGVEGGKVAIKQDTVVAKEGTVVDAKLAGLLMRLGIEPMEIGLDLVCVFENGEIIPKKVLDIDEEEYTNNMRLAASESFNLAMFIAYPCKETVELLVSKAHAEAKALATEQNILTDETVGLMLGKAELEMKALKTKLNIQIPEKKHVVKEEPKMDENKEVEEEKKEEVKEEAELEEKKETENEKLHITAPGAEKKEKTEDEMAKELKQAIGPQAQRQVTDEDIRKTEAFVEQLHRKRMKEMSLK